MVLSCVGDRSRLCGRLFDLLDSFEVFFSDLIDRKLVLDVGDIDVFFDDLPRFLAEVVFGVFFPIVVPLECDVVPGDPPILFPARRC
jgi:hypothetical protein